MTNRPRYAAKRVDMFIPEDLHAKLDDYRATRRPIPNETEAIRQLLEFALSQLKI